MTVPPSRQVVCSIPKPQGRHYTTSIIDDPMSVETPAPTPTQEELLKELRENPQVGDSWNIGEGDSFKTLREIKILSPLTMSDDWASYEKTVDLYVAKFGSGMYNIKLVPRAPKQQVTSVEEMASQEQGTPIPVETPCQIAQRITTTDRRDVYGHPADDFKRIADMWSAYLGVPITAEQVGMCQILVKVGRLAHTPGHWDSICDTAGYANCVGMIKQELDRRAKETK